ncbi:MAG TPA: type II secretion system minor pseudopilin GspK [Spongiibacteraceae bacterium]|nr:type II secretion system minor pseudopilin GspK [Spongiibacteraceae bacterium]
MRARQSGVALITVLLVFALATVIAAEMLRRSQLSLRSVGNLLSARQAYYYALGGEAYARQILAKDALDSTVDTLQEPWALTKDQPPFAIDNGSMKVEIKDLQGRFNLNGMLDSTTGAVDPNYVTQFQLLLKALQLNPKYASEWADWVDKDPQVVANGAEDADYPNYRTANQAESDISALRLLRSMQAEDYAKLAPHVAVLPKKKLSPTGEQVPIVAPMNVNTADAIALRAILSDTQVGQVLARQQSGGYKNTGELAGLPVNQLDVRSSFFEVVVTVNYDDRWQRLRTVLMRDGTTGATLVISRVRSPLFDDSEQP